MREGLAERGDAELMRASDDPAAFAELYRRHVEAVYGWFRQRLPWAASDLTAETFAQAWLSRRRFRDERGGTALPWLLGIARNLLRQSARQERIATVARQRLGLPTDLAIEDGYDGVDAHVSPSAALLTAVDELPDHERRAVELRVVEQRTYPEVAEILSIRPTAARLRVSRGLRRLRSSLSEEDT